MSAMSKKKLHTYCVFETPNRWESIVVTGHFAFCIPYSTSGRSFLHFCIPYSTFERFFSLFFSSLQKSPCVQAIVGCSKSLVLQKSPEFNLRLLSPKIRICKNSGSFSYCF